MIMEILRAVYDQNEKSVKARQTFTEANKF